MRHRLITVLGRLFVVVAISGALPVAAQAQDDDDSTTTNPPGDDDDSTAQHPTGDDDDDSTAKHPTGDDDDDSTAKAPTGDDDSTTPQSCDKDDSNASDYTFTQNWDDQSQLDRVIVANPNDPDYKVSVQMAFTQRMYEPITISSGDVDVTSNSDGSMDVSAGGSSIHYNSADDFLSGTPPLSCDLLQDFRAVQALVYGVNNPDQMIDSLDPAPVDQAVAKCMVEKLGEISAPFHSSSHAAECTLCGAEIVEFCADQCPSCMGCANETFEKAKANWDTIQTMESDCKSQSSQ
jgi:hypothetical protein